MQLYTLMIPDGFLLIFWGQWWAMYTIITILALGSARYVSCCWEVPRVTKEMFRTCGCMWLPTAIFTCTRCSCTTSRNWSVAPGIVLSTWLLRSRRCQRKHRQQHAKLGPVAWLQFWSLDFVFVFQFGVLKSYWILGFGFCSFDFVFWIVG